MGTTVKGSDFRPPSQISGYDSASSAWFVSRTTLSEHDRGMVGTIVASSEFMMNALYKPSSLVLAVSKTD